MVLIVTLTISLVLFSLFVVLLNSFLEERSFNKKLKEFEVIQKEQMKDIFLEIKKLKYCIEKREDINMEIEKHRSEIIAEERKLLKEMEMYKNKIDYAKKAKEIKEKAREAEMKWFRKYIKK